MQLEFEIDEDANERIISYMSLANVTTKREYINNALALMKWAIDARIEGRRIASVDEEHTTYRPFTMLALDEIDSLLHRQPRAPLSGCVQEAPILTPLPNDESPTDEGIEVREACSDVISSVGYLLDSIDSDDDPDRGLSPLKYLYLMSAVADLTKAMVTYLEPEDGGEPFLYD